MKNTNTFGNLWKEKPAAHPVFSPYIEFAWPHFGGGYRVGFERSCWKLPPCLTETMPGGSKENVQAKAEPSSDGGNTSVITYLRRKKVIAQM